MRGQPIDRDYFDTIMRQCAALERRLDQLENDSRPTVPFYDNLNWPANSVEGQIVIAPATSAFVDPTTLEYTYTTSTYHMTYPWSLSSDDIMGGADSVYTIAATTIDSTPTKTTYGTTFGDTVSESVVDFAGVHDRLLTRNSSNPSPPGYPTPGWSVGVLNDASRSPYPSGMVAGPINGGYVNGITWHGSSNGNTVFSYSWESAVRPVEATAFISICVNNYTNEIHRLTGNEFDDFLRVGPVAGYVLGADVNNNGYACYTILYGTLAGTTWTLNSPLRMITYYFDGTTTHEFPLTTKSSFNARVNDNGLVTGIYGVPRDDSRWNGGDTTDQRAFVWNPATSTLVFLDDIVPEFSGLVTGAYDINNSNIVLVGADTTGAPYAIPTNGVAGSFVTQAFNAVYLYNIDTGGLRELPITISSGHGILPVAINESSHAFLAIYPPYPATLVIASPV